MENKKNRLVSFWCKQINAYEKQFSKWEKKGEKIEKRYKDERPENENNSARFNILWSNVQTLAPAIYAQNPIPNVDRRFEDDDKVGTTAARILERSVSYFVDEDLFSNVMEQTVLDRLLPGRGTAWVRYVPNFQDVEIENKEAAQEGVQLTEDIQAGDDTEPEQELYDENVVVDYVNWKDFGHSYGRTWEEVRGVWRKVYLDRSELKARFKNGKDVPFEKDDENNAMPKACVYEVWDKQKKQVVWLHKSMEKELDKKPDPLQLSGFFPCPKPIYSTLANDNLVPSPDYIQYQDQAVELDNITGRINEIQKALKVVGVYDASAEGLQRLLSEGLENKMVPVENWAVFGEKGGIKGVVDFLPIKDIVDTLVALYSAREKVKQDLYEITGISDIIRGATNANETATAQQIKGQFATLRLDNMQKDVARFSRDLVRFMAEIIAEHFSIETIKQISAIKLMSEQEKQMTQAKIQQSQQQQPQPGQPPPEIPDEIQELLDLPTWEEVEALLKDDTLRGFRISIETNSTIKADQEAEKQSRNELISNVGTFLGQAATLPPQLQAMASELLLFGVKGHKISRELECTFEKALKEIKKAAENPQPDPQEAKDEAALQAEQAKMQLEMQKLEFEKQKFQIETQQAGQTAQNEAAADERNINLEHQRLASEERKAVLEAKTKVSADVAMADPDFNGGQSPIGIMVAQMSENFSQGLKQIAELQIESNEQVINAITAPKEVIKDRDGKLVGVRTLNG